MQAAHGFIRWERLEWNPVDSTLKIAYHADRIYEVTAILNHRYNTSRKHKAWFFCAWRTSKIFLKRVFLFSAPTRRTVRANVISMMNGAYRVEYVATEVGKILSSSSIRGKNKQSFVESAEQKFWNYFFLYDVTCTFFQCDVTTIFWQWSVGYNCNETRTK